VRDVRELRISDRRSADGEAIRELVAERRAMREELAGLR
jgi:hypothetical protein